MNAKATIDFHFMDPYLWNEEEIFFFHFHWAFLQASLKLNKSFIPFSLTAVK